MFSGDPSSVPAGDNQDFFRVFDILDDGTGLGATVTLEMAPGYGGMFVAIICDGMVQHIVWIDEGEVLDNIVIAYDVAKTRHGVSPHPLGGWNNDLDLDITYEHRLFFSDNGISVVLEWDAVIEELEAYDDDGQLSAWSLTGLQRFDNCDQYGNRPTQGKLDLTLTDAAGTRTVTLYKGDLEVASGSRSGDGSITLTEQNDSGLSGSVTVAYTGDLEAADGAYLGVRWAASYNVHFDTSLSFPRSPDQEIEDDGLSNRFAATVDSQSAGTYAYVIQAVTDTDVEGTNTATIGTIAVPGPPEPPGELSYVSGDYSATVIQFEASETVGATYRLYDSELGRGVNFASIADTRVAGTGTLQWTLPSLGTPAAGYRRFVVVAVDGGIEDGLRRELQLEYDADGNVVPARPNAPGVYFESADGLELSAQYTYDPIGEAVAAAVIQLFLVAEDGTVDWTRPDGVVEVSPDVAVEVGTVEGTAGADGWFQYSARAASAPGDVANVYGDASSQLSAWALTGADTDNTDNGVLYWTLTDSGGTRTVNLYDDSAKTSLVSAGSRSGDGSITLAEQNSSGLSGSVTVAYTGDDIDAANVLHTFRQSNNTDLYGPEYLSDDVPAIPANVTAEIVP